VAARVTWKAWATPAASAILILKSWWDYLAGKALEVTGWSKKLTYSGWFVGINSLHQAKMRIAAAALGGSRKRNTVAIMEKIIKPPFQATARDRIDPTSRFEQARNLKHRP